MFSEPILTISLKADLKNNNNGQSRHWSTAHREKKIMCAALMDARVTYPGDGNLKLTDFLDEIMRHPFDTRVDISVTRILGRGQRLIDPDSICRGNCKQLIDEIAGLKIIVDDSAKFVGRVLGLQDSTQRERGPAIEITFWESPDDQSLGST